MLRGRLVYIPACEYRRRVVAIDIDVRMIEAAKIRFAERGGAPNCIFAISDAYDITRVVREPVDHVFLANAFHGVPDRSRLAQAIHDILKPGGLFALVNWDARPREQTTVLGEPREPATELRMTPEKTIAEVELSNLKQVQVSPYHYGAVFERPR